MAMKPLIVVEKSSMVGSQSTGQGKMGYGTRTKTRSYFLTGIFGLLNPREHWPSNEFTSPDKPELRKRETVHEDKIKIIGFRDERP